MTEPMSLAGKVLAAMSPHDLSCGCCHRTPARYRREQMTAIGLVPIVTCQWCEAAATRFINSHNAARTDSFGDVDGCTSDRSDA
jgi:hypothetical protein